MLNDDSQVPSTTLLTSLVPTHPSPTDGSHRWQETPPHESTNIVIHISSNNGSTGKGILIGMLSAFGSAAFVVLIFAIFYFFKYTSRGRIFLDRIGRPGEYDDEQALAREEAEALEEMGDIDRLEYLRAKGRSRYIIGYAFLGQVYTDVIFPYSFYTSQPTRIISDRHLAVPVPSHTRKRRFCMGI